jgi:hypothetical protein
MIMVLETLPRGMKEKVIGKLIVLPPGRKQRVNAVGN